MLDTTTLPPPIAAQSGDSRKGYSFSSPPKTVSPHGRASFNGSSNGNHMMFDRRVHRGSNYTLSSIPKADPVGLMQKIQNNQRKNTKDRIALQTRVETPEAVPGRQHLALQTDLYLEELVLKVPERDVFTMTDAFLDRPPSPVYVPMKSGVDAATQIYDGELFDFDLEVEPILEVLVGKIVEQGYMEVLEEEELKMLKEHQTYYENKRNAEMAEVQRLEEAERRRVEEKQRRLAEQERLFKEKVEMSKKLAAQQHAQMLLRNMIPSVFDALTTNGYFYDVVEKQIESELLPGLTGNIMSQLMQRRVACQILDELIRNSFLARRAQKA